MMENDKRNGGDPSLDQPGKIVPFQRSPLARGSDDPRANLSNARFLYPLLSIGSNSYVNCDTASWSLVAEVANLKLTYHLNVHTAPILPKFFKARHLATLIITQDPNLDLPFGATLSTKGQDLSVSARDPDNIVSYLSGLLGAISVIHARNGDLFTPMELGRISSPLRGASSPPREVAVSRPTLQCATSDQVNIHQHQEILTGSLGEYYTRTTQKITSKEFFSQKLGTANEHGYVLGKAVKIEVNTPTIGEKIPQRDYRLSISRGKVFMKILSADPALLKLAKDGAVDGITMCWGK